MLFSMLVDGWGFDLDGDWLLLLFASFAGCTLAEPAILLDTLFMTPHSTISLLAANTRSSQPPTGIRGLSSSLSLWSMVLRLGWSWWK